ncbi:MAG: hypothetical protein KAT70_00320, partial [Thermoplasmata archaeon]|nr:hypothetical protein [Thermoplasmata archaeon]
EGEVAKGEMVEVVEMMEVVEMVETVEMMEVVEEGEAMEWRVGRAEGHIVLRGKMPLAWSRGSLQAG